MPSLSPLETRTRVEEVRIRLIYAILRGELRQGDRLTESKLAADLGVSQATVNQALQDLDRQCIVRKTLNRGTTVSTFGINDVRQVFFVRNILEPAAASAAAEAVAGGAGLDRLHARVAEMDSAAAAGDLGAFCIADYEFHRAFYALSGNAFLISASQAVAAAPFAYILCSQPQPLPTDYVKLARDHGRLVEAIVSGPECANRLMREMLGRWLDFSAMLLKGPSEAAPPGAPEGTALGWRSEVLP